MFSLFHLHKKLVLPDPAEEVEDNGEAVDSVPRPKLGSLRVGTEQSGGLNNRRTDSVRATRTRQVTLPLTTKTP